MILPDCHEPLNVRTLITVQSEKYSGSIIIKETIITNGKTDVKYSLNIPTISLGDGKSIGVPISIGASVGGSGFNINASVGIDLIVPKFSLNANVGFNSEEVVSAKVNTDIGWLDDKVGGGVKLPVSPWESLRLFLYHQGVINGIKKYDEWGVHIKMGVAYVVVLAALLLYGMVTGTYDWPTVWQQLQQYWKNLKECPI